MSAGPSRRGGPSWGGDGGDTGAGGSTGDSRRDFNRYKRLFTGFLEFDGREGSYRERVRAMLERHERRLVINMDHLRQFDPDLAYRFLLNPNEYMEAFHDALKTFVSTIADPSDEDDPELRKAALDDMEYYIGVEGAFGDHHVSPRGLSSSFVRNLVCVEGIVTKCSLVRPKVMKSVHYCEETNKTISRTYVDATSTTGIPTPTAYPTKDENGNPLVTEYGLSVYKDHQMVTIQEMPERAPAGQLPRSVDIVVENDLVDQMKPGDRVQVVGVYRALSSFHGQGRGVFRTLLIANNIKQLAREVSGPVLTDVDIGNIKELAKREDVFNILSASLAPSIYGHEFIKRSLLLLLLGGVERNLANGTHLRGDINMLMVGDPSTAKSQLLRFVLNIAPLAINTTGRGSSGVGLTAAVTSDPETGERRLEAGAMVLADRGVVCIDEFDKMSEDDRVAIHEVMEQQTVTIAKAGIHTSLNARCSVIAAANPVYGQYNRQKKPTENIGLPDSLLSRFDLLFIVLDTLNPEHDREISEHVLRMHRYRRAGDYEGRPSFHSAVLGGELDDYADEDTADDEEGGGTTPVWQRFDKLLHGSRNRQGTLVSIPFIQKYILYCKSRVKPRLTDQAKDAIASAFTQLRSKEDMKTLPVTARTLETMIRLSEAHAKCRLSHEVEVQDTVVALELMNFALYHEATPQVKTKPGARADGTNGVDGANGTGTDGRGNADEDDGEDRGGKGKRKRADGPSGTQGVPGRRPDLDDMDLSQSQSQGDGEGVSQGSQSSADYSGPSGSQASQSQDVNITEERRKQFRSQLNVALGPLRRGAQKKQLRLDEIEQQVNASSGAAFITEEVLRLLGELLKDNALMVTRTGEYCRL
eukprot:TRINITY_DN1858_c0_g1_i1.p1 TRINITY_DN1858_c0_g1~~TRINITY_DN1858_c0_g1_i1.p1  ORF type:complete len:869 (+),score=246.30 TRINITY_DN1858_c0_g1_i1:35-2641(+)